MTHPDQLIGKPKRKVAVKPNMSNPPLKRNIRDHWFYLENGYLVGELAPLWDDWVNKRIGKVYEYSEVMNNGVQEEEKEQKEKQVKRKTQTKARSTA